MTAVLTKVNKERAAYEALRAQVQELLEDTPVLSKGEAAVKGLQQITEACDLPADLEIVRSVLRDMRRGSTIHAVILHPGSKLVCVTVWRTPALAIPDIPFSLS